MSSILKARYFSGYFITITFIILLFAFPSAAQQKIFSPAAVNEATLKSLLSKFEESYKKSLAALPSENKKDFAEIYKDRWENIRESFDTKEIYTSAEAQQYLDAITSEIVKANAVLQNYNLNCFFSRSGVPNACYKGEGVILFNMGLFTRLNNQSQVAFALCHEISHLYLRHIENSIDRYVATMNSKEVQKELRSIKRKEYNKREQLDKLITGLTFSSRRHSRDHEGQADSMAVVFMHNTRFDITQALSTLAILDSVDIENFKTDSCLVKTFNTPGYPFQRKWIAKEDGLLGGHAVLENDKKIEDSVKTHPDCKTRIKLLEPLVQRLKVSNTANVINPTLFNELRNTFKFEVIEYAFANDNYTRSLYYTLQMLDSIPSDPYLITQVGKILNACHKAQKEHTLSKHIDLPAPYYRPNYNLLLQFIQNLYLDDYASISYHFLKKYNPDLEKYKGFKEAWNTSIQEAKE